MPSTLNQIKILLKINGQEEMSLFGSEGFGLNKNTVANSDFIFKIKINKKWKV